METFDVSWLSIKNNKRFIIGHLSYDVEQKQWKFIYNINEIVSAIQNGFIPFPEFNDINQIYKSTTLFSTFSERILTRDSIPSLNIYDNLVLLDLLKIVKPLMTDNILIHEVKESTINYVK